MTLLHKSSVYGVSGISDEETKDILTFLQGTVYSWCKSKGDEWFSLRDLMGGINFYWEGTPLNKLYFKHLNKDKLPDIAIRKAGKDAGMLLKRVINEDKRLFETKRGQQIRKYLWIK